LVAFNILISYILAHDDCGGQFEKKHENYNF